MWKLIKMDFYRLFSGKALKIGMIAACLVCAAYMFLSLGIVEIAKFALKEDPDAADGMGMFLAQVAWINGVDFAEVVLSGTSAFALFVGCMLTANFIGSEQSCGYVKNIAGQLPDRGYMVISKFIVTCFFQFVVLVIYTAVSAIFAPLFFNVTAYSISKLFAALGLRLILHFAINAIIVFICTFTKSHAIAMVIGSIFGIGITKFVYMIVSMLLSAIKINFDIAKYMPDGINSQLAVDTVDTLWVKSIVIALIFTTAFLVANYLIVKKRDVK